MEELNVYEGVCRYCGSVESIMAESEEAANDEVSKTCDCNGEKEDKKRKLLLNRIDELCKPNTNSMFEPLLPLHVEILKTLAIKIYEGYIEKASIHILVSRFNITGGKKIKVTRTASNQDQVEVER